MIATRGAKILALVLFLFGDHVCAGPPRPTRVPLVRVIDLNIGEAQEVELCDGKKASVRLLELEERRGEVMSAVREARVRVEVNGRPVVLSAALYHLPVTVAGVRIDCSITKGPVQNSHMDHWGLIKDARLRLWPADSPLLAPGTFVYPVKQRWFASGTSMANEPVSPRPQGKLYYHAGLDFGGAEGMVEVIAATDGLVVSCGNDVLPGYDQTPVRPRGDVVYVLDARGWYYRYSHLFEIDEVIRPGAKVRQGQPVGLLGKEGGSGGWSHLHFDIKSRQPSGKWGIQEAYAFIWEAYQQHYAPKLVAIARPSHHAFAGQKVVLDGTRSWSADGKIASYEWTFTDGTTASGAQVERTYARAGTYSEILRITDSAGRGDYDFARVSILDPAHRDRWPPRVHAAYFPTMNIEPGDPVTFKVRAFNTTSAECAWDFGDGSPVVTVKSVPYAPYDGYTDKHARGGYAVTVHRFPKPGNYLVRAEGADEHGLKAIAHLHVEVAKEKRGSKAGGQP